jgi:polyhydroxyalkanoate synthesis regulator protein
LRHLIGFYDDSLQSYLPRYLELSMENFARHQDQMRGYVEQTFGRFFPLTQLEDMTRQNMALFQRAASMFRPFPPGAEGVAMAAEQGDAAWPVAGAEKPAGIDAEMRDLRERMESLQRQLDTLQKAPPAAE